jgi:hypothetical protein
MTVPSRVRMGFVAPPWLPPRATLAVPRRPIEAVFPLPAFRARSLDRDVAQVTYNSAVSHDGVVQHARRSSIWSRGPTGWRLRFHQGTPFHRARSPDLERPLPTAQRHGWGAYPCGPSRKQG